jgi:catechol-2,3-dioxygenase
LAAGERHGDFMTLSQCHMQVKNMAKARKFYEGVFEFSEHMAFDDDEVVLRNSEGFIIELEKVDKPEALPLWFFYGFDVKNEAKLKEIHDRVKKLGFSVLREIQDLDEEVNFYCADPDGIQIKVYFNR